MEEVLSHDIPALMKFLPGAEEYKFAERKDLENPFADNPDQAPVQSGWRISYALKRQYDNEFFSLNVSNDNKISGGEAKKAFLKSKLPTTSLRQIWDLADIDKDGALDAEEFAVAMFLIEQLNNGEITELPAILPEDVIPPSKRK